MERERLIDPDFKFDIGLLIRCIGVYISERIKHPMRMPYISVHSKERRIMIWEVEDGEWF